MTTNHRPPTSHPESSATGQHAAAVGGRSSIDGLRIVITRSAGKADGMAARLRELGAEPVIFPTIAYAPPDDTASLDAALAHLVDGQYDWLVITSGQVVKALAERSSDIGIDLPSAVRHLHVAAVGPATAATCQRLLGVQPAAVPEQFIAEGLAATLGDLTGKHVLLPKADIGRPTLEDLLRAAGAQVDRVVAYRNVPSPDNGMDMAGMLAAGQISAVTFTSGSTARAFVQKVGPEAQELLRRTVVACIGPAADVACRSIGLVPQVVAEVFTEEGLVDALIAYMEVRQ